MKTYYCVCTICYDDGRVICDIIDKKRCEEKPESTFKSGKRFDAYTDWYSTRAQAQREVDNAKNA